MPTEAAIQSNNREIKVLPRRVVLLNQRQLPPPSPFFDGLLRGDGSLHALVELIPDQLVNPVATGETDSQVIPVFPNPLDQVRGDADLEGPVSLAGENIDGRLSQH